MGEIHILDSATIDKIAAGEVVERPKNVVKELVENAIDSGAEMITVEIKDGGISMIRVTDDGSGIGQSEVSKVFLRHATSKIESADDLSHITSLGFRGEALSSIAAVSQVELITKTKEEFTGTQICVNGGEMQKPSEVGAPDGTTIVVRNIFYNTPARRKFLKSKTTEGTYISDLMQQMALSRPDIALKYIQNGQTRFFTSGNGSVSEIIYRIYGKDTASNVFHAQMEMEGLKLDAYLGKPVLNRSSRAFETFFVNGRYVKSNIFSNLLEEGYKNHLMQHRFPFAVLYFTIDTDRIDVNVHPAKTEIRIQEPERFYGKVRDWIKQQLLQNDLIPEVRFNEKTPSSDEINTLQKKWTKYIPEPFEKVKAQTLMRETGVYEAKKFDVEKLPVFKRQDLEHNTATQTGRRNEDETDDHLRTADQNAEESNAPDSERVQDESSHDENQPEESFFEERTAPARIFGQTGLSANPSFDPQHSNVIKPQDQKNISPIFDGQDAKRHANILKQKDHIFIEKPEQLDLSFDKFFEESTKEKYVLLGQIFETYWLITCNDKLFIMDQHAAHEKVMYERLVRQMEEHTLDTQQLNPPIILTLTLAEQNVYQKYERHFRSLGFLLENFGGNEFALREVPMNVYGYNERELFLSVLDSLIETPLNADITILLEKIASMSCKAAVKGNQKLSFSEAQELVDTLFTLKNPYNCPHGRPTVISMSKHEIEKKFKRIV